MPLNSYEHNCDACVITGRRQRGGDVDILNRYVEEPTTKPTNLILACDTVIDIHCHTAGIGAGNSGCFISPELRKSWKYRVYLNSFGVQEHELLQYGDELVLERLSASLTASGKVDMAVVLAMDGFWTARANWIAAAPRCTSPMTFWQRR